MLNFMIYNSNKEPKFYKFMILNIFGGRTEKFKIHDFSNDSDTSLENKIYILSSNNINEVIKIARRIRNKDDWHSQIILVANKIDNKTLNECNKLLIFDYINADDNIEDNLKSTIVKACYIITADETIDFMVHGEIYKIPYKDILFIEKENNLNYSIIHTKNETIKVHSTIKNIDERLDSTSFFKTHRSCIINLNNVTKYQYTNNIIYFGKKKTNLISREKKQILKEKLLENKTVD